MKIIRLETLRLGEFPNLVWLRLDTDQGVSVWARGVRRASVEAYLHEYVAPRVLGRDPLELRGAHGTGAALAWRRGPFRHSTWRSGTCTASCAASRSTRCWAGRAAVRSAPTTPAPARYIRSAGGQSTSNWGLDGKSEGPYEDLDAFLHRADELAHSLLEQGISAMKIRFVLARRARTGFMFLPRI